MIFSGSSYNYKMSDYVFINIFSNEMQQLAVYLFTARSLYMLRVLSHPSTGVHKTVTTAFSTGHIIGAAISFQRGQVGHVRMR